MVSSLKAACCLAVCAVLLSACAGGGASEQPSGKSLIISRQVDAHFQKYLRDVRSGKAGAFAVSEDGTAAFYSMCESGACSGQYHFSSEAVRGCEKFGRGRCVVLASNGVVKRPYKVE